MKKVCIFLLFITLLVINLYGEEIYILFSNNCNGILESCRCPTHPYGGFAKRAYYIKEFKRKYPDTIVVDAGDAFAILEDKVLNKYIPEALEICNYDAVAVGDQELVNNFNFFKRVKRKVNFVCANLFIKRGKRKKNFVLPYIIKKINGIKIGIIGLIGEDAYYYIKDKSIIYEREEIVLKKILKKNKFDYTILLYHTKLDNAKKIGEKFSKINLIVCGHTQELIEKPIKIKNSYIVEAGSNCQYIGKIKVKIKKNSVKLVEYEIITLDDDIKEDENIKQVIKKVEKGYQKESESLIEGD